MAAKYARAVGGGWNTDATWSTTSGGAADTTKPTAADDVFLDASSGNVTVDAASACRSLNCTGYTGTLAFNNFTLSIGDATAGASNIALKFVAGMLVTFSNVTSTIAYVSTSATVQTIDYAGKNVVNTTFDANGGSYQLTGTWSTSNAASVTTLTRGTLDTNGQTVTWGKFLSDNSNTRVITLGSSNITILVSSAAGWQQNSITNCTFTANTATVTFTGSNITNNWPNVNFNGTSFVYAGSGNYTQVFTTSTPVTVRCANFTFTGAASKTQEFISNDAWILTGTFTVNSNSNVNRVLVRANRQGTAVSISANSVVVGNTVDFQDITGAGAATWTVAGTGATYLGDCGGNSGITFTTAETQTCTMSSNQNWETVGIWTSRVPLPQDDVVFTGATGGNLLTAGMPRLGKNMDFTGASGSFAFTPNIANFTVYGSLTLSSTTSYGSSNSIIFAGRDSCTITSAGKTFGGSVTIQAPGGSYTLNDALSTSGSFLLVIGGFDVNNFNVTSSTLSSGNSNTRSLTLGTGTWSITSTANATVWDISTSTGMTFSGNLATIVISSASTNQRNFASGGNYTYGVLDYRVAGSTGILKIQGSNLTFSALKVSDTSGSKTLHIESSRTITISTGSGWQVFGRSGALVTVNSSTAATHTIICPSGTIASDYLNLSNSIASGNVPFYAGSHSVDGGGNVNWLFKDDPNAGGVGDDGLTEFLLLKRLIGY